MAYIEKSHWYDLNIHRDWEDILSMILGVVVILSPAFFQVTDSSVVTFSTCLTGTLIFAVAALEMVGVQRWEEAIELLLGAWLVAAPFVLGYVGMERTLHIAIGLAVAALAVLELWQDRRRAMS